MAKAYTTKGIDLLNDKKFDSTINYLSNALKVDDQNSKYLNKHLANSYSGKGLLLLDNNNFDEAIECFNNAVSIDVSCKKSVVPSLIVAYCKKGDIEKDKNDFKAAITNYERALEFQENNTMAIKLAQCYHVLSQFQYELSILDRLIHSIPNNIDLYMMRAEAHTLLRDYDSALNDYGIVNKIEEKYLNAYMKRMYIFFIQKNYNAIFDICLIIINIDRNNKEASYILHILHNSIKNTALLIEKRNNWERSTSYLENTKLPFKCSNCSFYSNTTSTCNKMEESHVFPLTSDGARCHQYRKYPFTHES